MKETSPPVICIVGFSGSGKTTVMSGLVSELASRGLIVGTIKHDVHGFSMDRPGKDSFRHKAAGARTSVVTSPWGMGMVADADCDRQPEALLHLFQGHDIVMAEGFKRSRLPKIEIFRPENGKPPACIGDEFLVAAVCDQPMNWGVPCFGFSQITELSDFILDLFQIRQGKRAAGRGDLLRSTWAKAQEHGENELLTLPRASCGA